MASVTVAHNPKLTLENATEAFKEHFGDKYEVAETSESGQLRRIVMKQSKWTGVQVHLVQTRDKTMFGFQGFMPPSPLQMLFGGLIAVLFLRQSWKLMEEEVETFIQNAAAFK